MSSTNSEGDFCVKSTSLSSAHSALATTDRSGKSDNTDTQAVQASSLVASHITSTGNKISVGRSWCSLPSVTNWVEVLNHIQKDLKAQQKSSPRRFEETEVCRYLEFESRLTTCSRYSNPESLRSRFAGLESRIASKLTDLVLNDKWTSKCAG